MDKTVNEQIRELRLLSMRQQGEIDKITGEIVDNHAKEICQMAMAHEQEIATIKMMMEAPQCR